MDTTAAARMTRAKTGLLLDHPWFGSLALRLRVREVENLGTMGTDGTELIYDPVAIGKWSDAELQGVIAHEVLHCALLHMYRCANRDMRRWNIACDYAINDQLVAAGLTLPDGMLFDPIFSGRAAEQIYPHLSQDAGGTGRQPDFFRPPQSGDGPDGQGVSGNTEQDWQIAGEQAAMVARKAGNMPGDLDRAIRSTRESRTDWRTILRRFVEKTMPSDYSWSSPNRRFVGQGIYLPGVIRDNAPRLGVAIDTSGSVSADSLARFASELTAILHEVRPSSLDVIYVDTDVRGHDAFTPDHGEVALHARGGGGTRFQPAFDWFATHGDEPAAVIYLTDLEGPAPKEPPYPVLWVTEAGCNYPAPFGQKVTLDP